MRSPTKSPDLTMGTFAQAQAAKRAKVLAPEAINLTAVAPGETVVVADVKGAEVVGTAFYMSGGGKGPAGQGKANYKSTSLAQPR